MAIVNNAGLSGILSSRSNFGTVQSDGNTGVQKSGLFSGIAKIVSAFSQTAREDNIRAKQNFLSSMQKEFGFDEREYNRMASKIDVDSGKPLSLSTAKYIIGVFQERREVAQHLHADNLRFEIGNAKKERDLHSGVDSGPEFIPLQSGEMKNVLTKMIHKGGSEEEVRNEVGRWLRSMDQDSSAVSIDMALQNMGIVLN